MAELKKESHRPEPCEVNAKLLSVSERWCQTLARPRKLRNVGLRSERVTVGSAWGDDVSHTLVVILGYFISAVSAPKKKFCVPFMFEISSLYLSLEPNIEIIVLQCQEQQQQNI